MKKYIILPAALVVALGMNPGAARATSQSEAVKTCQKNPNCHVTKIKGGVGIHVDGGGSRGEVWCPDNGPCQCLLCTPTRKAAIESVRGTIVGNSGNATDDRGDNYFRNGRQSAVGNRGLLPGLTD